MKLKINVTKFEYGVMVILLSIYSFTRGGIGLLIPNKVWGIALMAVLTISLLVLIKKQKIVRGDIPVIIMILEVLLWYNWDFNNSNWFIDFIIVVFLIFLLSGNKSDIWFDLAIKMITIMGVFHAFWTIICYISPNTYYTVILPVVNPIAQWNLELMYKKGFITGFNYSNSQNAIFLTSGIIACISKIYYSNKTNKIKIKDIMLLLILIVCLLLTGKRGPICWIFLAFVFVHWIYNCDKPTSRIFKIIKIIALLIIITYIVSFFVPEVLNFIDRFIEMNNEGNITTYRIELWKLGWDGFLKSPFVGNGWFWFKYHNYFGTTYNVHNCYIQWLCELGLIGAIPWFCFVIINLYHTIYLMVNIRLKRIRDDNNILQFISFSLFYQIYFLLYAFASTSFYEPECLLPYIFSSAIIMHYWSSFRKGHLNQIDDKEDL